MGLPIHYKVAIFTVVFLVLWHYLGLRKVTYRALVNGGDEATVLLYFIIQIAVVFGWILVIVNIIHFCWPLL